MTDLITRLRDRCAFGQFPGDARWTMLAGPDEDCRDAADEIERLRTSSTLAEVERLTRERDAALSALATERERCAMIAESMTGRVRGPIAKEIAVAIRRNTYEQSEPEATEPPTDPFQHQRS